MIYVPTDTVEFFIFVDITAMRSTNILLTLWSWIFPGLVAYPTRPTKPPGPASLRDYFYVGGEYAELGNGGGHIFKNQMYVEHLVPLDGIRKPLPLVFIHGQAQTGTVSSYPLLPNHFHLRVSGYFGCFRGTTIRPLLGKIEYFLANVSKELAEHSRQPERMGIVVYRKRLRSVYHRSDRSGAIPVHPREWDLELIHRRNHPGTLYRNKILKIMASGVIAHPMARGLFLPFILFFFLASSRAHVIHVDKTGMMGDPTFDAYYASNVQFLANTSAQQTAMQAAGAALLDRIGPAVLIAHSQGGLFPWLIADARPNLVKSIVSIEPTGPPFRDVLFSKTSARKFGLTDIAMAYNPPVKDPSVDLKVVEIGTSTASKSSCLLQAEPVRQLVNLMDIPVLIVTAEASFHAVYDFCTVEYLRQAGVNTEHLRLEEVGIHGNGHMSFMEKNNLVIAAIIERWIRVH
jgi:pimeloyl-ACP methyl ester carboxylesterase